MRGGVSSFAVAIGGKGEAGSAETLAESENRNAGRKINLRQFFETRSAIKLKRSFATKKMNPEPWLRFKPEISLKSLQKFSPDASLPNVRFDVHVQVSRMILLNPSNFGLRKAALGAAFQVQKSPQETSSVRVLRIRPRDGL